MELTKKQCERLASYEGAGRPFSTLLDSGYIRTLTTAETDTLLAVYSDATGKDYPLHRHCGQCVMEFVRIMAEAYRRAVRNAEAKDATRPKTQPKVQQRVSKRRQQPQRK